MTRTSSARTRLFARAAAPVVLASMLAACSSIPDWVDPTSWFGGDSQASSDQSGSTNADAAQTPDSGQTPDLASIPPKPTPPSTPDEQQQVSNSLAADRAQAQYSAESLQGGTEPVAPPPPPESSSTVPADQAASTPAAPAPTGSTDSAPPADSSTNAADNSAPPAATADNAAQPAATDSSGTQVASTAAPSTTAPAAAPMAAATSSAPVATDMQTRFAPSHAPALDASVTQYVPQRILSRYQQTAAAAAVPGVEGMPASGAKPGHRRKVKAAQTEPAADTAAPAQ